MSLTVAKNDRQLLVILVGFFSSIALVHYIISLWDVEPTYNEYVLGLRNPWNSNSCYFNSILQSLAGLPRLRQYLSRVNVESEYISSLKDLMNTLCKPIPRRASISAQSFISTLEKIYKAHLSSDQQDAQEFLGLVIENIEKEARDTCTPFNGKTISRLGCLKCGYQPPIKEETFQFLTLLLPQTSSTTINACIEKYCETELIEGFTCRGCAARHLEFEGDPETIKDVPKLKCPVSRRVEISAFPDILVLQFNRSEYRDGRFSKNNARVEIHEKLILSDTEYFLRSMITHVGNVSRGHYIAWRKAGKKMWWSLSDEKVRLLDASSLCTVEKDIYLMFFEKKSREKGNSIGEQDKTSATTSPVPAVPSA